MSNNIAALLGVLSAIAIVAFVVFIGRWWNKCSAEERRGRETSH